MLTDYFPTVTPWKISKKLPKAHPIEHENPSEPKTSKFWASTTFGPAGLGNLEFPPFYRGSS